MIFGPASFSWSPFPVPKGGSRSQLWVRTAPRPPAPTSKTNNDCQIKCKLLQVITGKLDQRTVVDDVRLGILTDHRGLHPIVQDLAWHPAQSSEGGHMAAQDGLQILVRDKACPDQPAVAKHQREQPDFANHAWLVGEDHLELRKINLSLLAWWGLEAHFERRCKPRSHLAQKVGHRGVAAVIALLADLAQQPATGQARIGDDPLAQISLERFKPPWPRLAWAIGRWLQAALDVFAHCLAIDADPPRDRQDASPCR